MTTDTLTPASTDRDAEIATDRDLGTGPSEAAHIVFIPPELWGTTTAQAYVLHARIEGKEVEALCGHRWVPTRDPKPLPVCAKCYDLYAEVPGDGGEVPDA